MKGRIRSIGTWVMGNPALAIGATIALGAGAVGAAFLTTLVQPSAAYVTATTTPLTQEVDTTATVKAAEAVQLSFERSGRVASVQAQAGTHVGAGTVIAMLDTASLSAALAQAQGALEVQQARLTSLENGTRPEQLAITQTTVSGAQTTLAQAKQTELDTIQSAYIQADDAIHNKADQMFVNPRTPSAILAFTVPDVVLANSIEQERIALEPVLSAWQDVVYAPSFSTATDTDALASSALKNLSNVASFLDTLSQALAQTPTSAAVPTATLQGWQTSITQAREAISGAQTAITTARTNEQAAQTAYTSATQQLTLQQDGATTSDIAAQKAQVDVAKAAVAAAQANLAGAIIRAPVAGTVTEQNAHVGETVSPNMPLVSFMADGRFEAEAYVSQTDVAKIKLGDAVEVRLSAYATGSSTPLTATVTAIDPAATMIQGAASYKVTVTFAKNDPRLKAGMTANMRIITAQVADALAVPTSAVIRNGNDTFVLVRTPAGGTEQVPVQTGITSADGKTQIISGIKAGTDVITFGGAAN